MKKDYLKNLVQVVGIIIIIILFYLLFQKIGLLESVNVDMFVEGVRSFGGWAPLVYISVMAIAIVISPIPSLPLAAASGIIWGMYLGTLYSIIGAEIGAIISFFIARKLGRSFIIKIFKKDITFSNVLVDRYGAYIIFIARLFPVFQFDIVSYGAGLTNIDWRKFALATFFGMIPATFLFTSLGNAVFISNFWAVLLGLLLILLIFLVPIILKKYDILGLNKES